MIKYAKITNEDTKECLVGLGNAIEFYESIGMTEMDVEQAWNGAWYVAGYCPEPPEPSVEEQVIALENQHHMYRWEREGILTADSPFSDYTKQIAQQIEELAEQLRDE